MDRSEGYGTLVAFTALSPVAVGSLLGVLLAPLFRSEPWIDWAAASVLAIGVLALAVSLLHLGRPWRAPLALRRLGSSWLSREVMLFGLFVVVVGCYTILSTLRAGEVTLYLVGFSGVVVGLGATVATGEIYRLSARPAWDQWLAMASFPLGALSTGSLLGTFVAKQFAGRSQVPGYAWIAVAGLLVLSLLATWLRSTQQRHEMMEARLSRQLALGPYLWLLIIRTGAVLSALVLIWIGGGAPFLAWIPALIGEFADRALFFKAMVPVTLRGRYL